MELTSSEFLTLQPFDSSKALSSVSVSGPMYRESSKVSDVWDGRFRYSRKEVRFSLLKTSPWKLSQPDHQFEIVVKGAEGSDCLCDHAGKKTTGGV